MAREPRDYTYVLHRTGTTLFKIGDSNNPDRRTIHDQRSSFHRDDEGFDNRLAVFKRDEYTEDEIQREVLALGARRVDSKHDMFDMPPIAIEYIKGLCGVGYLRTDPVRGDTTDEIPHLPQEAYQNMVLVGLYRLGWWHPKNGRRPREGLTCMADQCAAIAQLYEDQIPLSAYTRDIDAKGNLRHPGTESPEREFVSYMKFNRIHLEHAGLLCNCVHNYWHLTHKGVLYVEDNAMVTDLQRAKAHAWRHWRERRNGEEGTEVLKPRGFGLL